MPDQKPADASRRDDASAADNARATGFTLVGLGAFTCLVGFGVQLLQWAGRIHEDPFIGARGLIVLSLVNIAAGLFTLRLASRGRRDGRPPSDA